MHVSAPWYRRLPPVLASVASSFSYIPFLCRLPSSSLVLARELYQHNVFRFSSYPSLLSIVDFDGSHSDKWYRVPITPAMCPGCFGSTISMDTWYLANEIGCDPSPATEECICRPDLQAAGDSYLTQCVYKRCDQNDLDTNSAVSIYDSYCTAAGFMRENTPAPTISGTDLFPTVIVTSIRTVYISSTVVLLGSPPETHFLVERCWVDAFEIF
mgnify:CR=1 FL=1